MTWTFYPNIPTKKEARKKWGSTLTELERLFDINNRLWITIRQNPKCPSDIVERREKFVIKTKKRMDNIKVYI